VPCYTLFSDDYPLSSITKIVIIFELYKYNVIKILNNIFVNDVFSLLFSIEKASQT